MFPVEAGLGEAPITQTLHAHRLAQHDKTLSQLTGESGIVKRVVVKVNDSLALHAPKVLVARQVAVKVPNRVRAGHDERRPDAAKRVQRAIYSVERDVRHLAADPAVDGLGRRVIVGSHQRAKHGLTLRRNPHTRPMAPIPKRPKGVVRIRNFFSVMSFHAGNLKSAPAGPARPRGRQIIQNPI